MAAKCVLTGEIDDNYHDFLKFKEHKGTVFYMEQFPPVNYKDIEYFLPMVEGRIDGYYKVERVNIWEKNGKEQLRLKLSEYTTLGEEWVSINERMDAGELITMNYVNALYEHRD